MFGFLIGNKYLAIAKWIAIAAAVWYIFHTWDKAQGYDDVKKQLDASVAEHNAYVSTRSAQDQNDQIIGGKREDAIIDLRTQLISAREHHPDIRLHNCAASVKDSPVQDATSKPNAEDANGQREAAQQSAGPNISNNLYNIAENGDTCGITHNALVEWLHNECEIAKKDGRGCVDAGQ